MEKEEKSLKEICRPYYSMNTEIYEFGIINHEFFMGKIGEKKLYFLTRSSHDKKLKENIYRHIVEHKHLSHLSRIDYISNVSIKKDQYQVDIENGIIKAEHAPVKFKNNMNFLIEEYLDERFGKYKDFIKQWLAVFCYTNYKKLPHLILKGKRGTGKSTFSDIVSSIYPGLTEE